MDYLHTTKLIAPEVSANAIERTRLYHLLNLNFHNRVTIINAPAGYGKTTFTLQLLAQKKETFAWFALDAQDNDLHRFFTYLSHSVGEALQLSKSHTLYSLFEKFTIINFDIILDTFLLELTKIHQPFTIVFDDFHFITNTNVHEIIIKMIELSPQNINFIITSRVEPLLPIAKWQASQLAVEITQKHLMFTADETTEYINKFNYNELTAEDIENIYVTTEGWVTGVILMQLASSFVDESVSNKYITDYLWQEIFRSLKPSIRHFLMVTSLLQELQPNICNELTERTDSYEILEYLVSEGLFTIRIPSKTPMYRYHHLFIEVLQKEFHKNYVLDDIIEIAQLAVQLNYENGNVISAISLAIHYELYELALKIISEKIKLLSQPKYIRLFTNWLKQLQNNVHFVPYDVLLVGFSHSITVLDFELMLAINEELEHRQKIFHWMQEPANEAFVQIYNRLNSYALIATYGDLNNALTLLKENSVKTIHTSNPSHLKMVYNMYEAELIRTPLARKGALTSPNESEKVLSIFQSDEYIKFHVTGFILGIAAEVFDERMDDKSALNFMSLAFEYGYKYNDISLLIPMYFLKVKQLLRTKNFKVAHSTLLSLLNLTDDTHWLTLIQIMKANCYISEGKLNDAKLLLNTMKSAQPFWKIVFIRLLIKDKNYEEALSHAIQLKTQAQQEKQISTIIKASIYEAICHSALNEPKLALELLSEVFQLASRYYYIRLLFEEEEVLELISFYLEAKIFEENFTHDTIPSAYFVQLLLYFNQVKSKKIVLSSRELLLLQLLSDGYTHREIAHQLKLTMGTIRVYYSKLYKKINVKNKQAAIDFYCNYVKFV